MDGLELVVHQRQLDEEGQAPLVAQEAHQVREQRFEGGVTGRHEPGFLVGLPGPTQQHGARTDLTGVFFRPTDSLQQDGMDFPNEFERERLALPDLFQAVFHGQNVVAHLFGVHRVMDLVGLGFKQEKLIEASYGPFDLAGQDRFTSNERPDEQVGVGQHPPDAGQFPQRPVGFGHGLHQFQVHRQARR